MAIPKVYYNRLPAPAATCTETGSAKYTCVLPWLDNSDDTAYQVMTIDLSGSVPGVSFYNQASQRITLDPKCYRYQKSTSKFYFEGNGPECGLPFLKHDVDLVNWQTVAALSEKSLATARRIEALPKKDPERVAFKRMYVLREAGKEAFLATVKDRSARGRVRHLIDTAFQNGDLPLDLQIYRIRAMDELVEKVPELLALNEIASVFTGVPPALVLNVMLHESHLNPLAIEKGSGIGFGLGQFDKTTWDAAVRTPVFVTLFGKAFPGRPIPPWGTDNVFAQVLAIHVKFMNVAIKYRIPPSMDVKFLTACEASHAFGLFSPYTDKAVARARSLSSPRFKGRLENIVWLYGQIASRKDRFVVK